MGAANIWCLSPSERRDTGASGAPSSRGDSQHAGAHAAPLQQAPPLDPTPLKERAKAAVQPPHQQVLQEQPISTSGGASAWEPGSWVVPASGMASTRQRSAGLPGQQQGGAALERAGSALGPDGPGINEAGQPDQEGTSSIERRRPTGQTSRKAAGGAGESRADGGYVASGGAAQTTASSRAGIAGLGEPALSRMAGLELASPGGHAGGNGGGADAQLLEQQLLMEVKAREVSSQSNQATSACRVTCTPL